MILVDTSVWIEFFARPARLDINKIVDLDEVVTCLPVIQEVLQGLDDQRAYTLAREALFCFPILEAPLRAAVFVEAADLYRNCRRSGRTVRSSVDCLIAACALRNSATVLHRDRDFDALARVSTLRVQRA